MNKHITVWTKSLSWFITYKDICEELKTYTSYVQADNPIPEGVRVMSGMSNQNTFFWVWLLKRQIKGCAFSLLLISVNWLTRILRSAVVLLVIRWIDSWTAATICLAFYLSSLSIFSLGTGSLHWGTPLISFGAQGQAGSSGTTTGILKESRLCRHRVCPCGSAMPFSQGSQPLQKNPSSEPK